MDVWPRCLQRLEAELPLEDVRTWLKPLQADRREQQLVLYAPNAFVRDEVQSRFLARIRELVRRFDDGADVVVDIGAPKRAAAAAASPAAAAAFITPTAIRSLTQATAVGRRSAGSASSAAMPSAPVWTRFSPRWTQRGSGAMPAAASAAA